MQATEISNELRQNFHINWDNFPFPVMLIQKDRMILAINKTAQEMGIPEGTQCFNLADGAVCKGCQAGQALKEQSTKRNVSYNAAFEKVLDSYWVPLAGEEDLYLHLNVDITEHASEQQFPQIKGNNADLKSSV